MAIFRSIVYNGQSGSNLTGVLPGACRRSGCRASSRSPEEAGVYPDGSARRLRPRIGGTGDGSPYWLIPSDAASACSWNRKAIGWRANSWNVSIAKSIGWPPAPAAPEMPAEKPNLHATCSGLSRSWRWFCGPDRMARSWGKCRRLDAQGVFGRGEWWRLGTALFLTPTWGHLASNVLSGIFVFSAVLSTIGWRRGVVAPRGRIDRGHFAIAALNYPDRTGRLAPRRDLAGLGLLTGRAIRAVRPAGHPPAFTQHFKPTGGTPRATWDGRLVHVRGIWGKSRSPPLRAGVRALAAGLTLLGLFGAGDGARRRRACHRLPPASL